MDEILARDRSQLAGREESSQRDVAQRVADGGGIVVRFGDRRLGSPGIRMQTFCEESFELKVLVDAFATCDYVELPASPVLRRPRVHRRPGAAMRRRWSSSWPR